MPQYFLSTHSFVCEAGGHAVFLDLKHDKYTAVSPEDLDRLRRTVRGWPAMSPAATEGIALAPDLPNTTTDTPEDIIEVLVKEGLLTADASFGKDALPAQLDIPTESFLIAQRPWPLLTTRHLGNFVSRWAMTTLRLKTLPIAWIVNRVRRRKETRAHLAPPMDIRRARALTMIHFILQPAFYNSKDACLRNSLTLIEFLSCYDIYPQWVFGVHMNPFSAHAWVQYGPTVFTDPVAHIKTFTPIMVI